MFQCAHCDEKGLVPFFLPQDEEKKLPFCCQGCLTVYEILKENSLSAFYSIKNNSGILKRRSPVESPKSSYAYLDDDRFLKDHSYLDASGNTVMDFYLEGIHCLACLWLIEKIPDFTPGALRSKLNLEKSVASISISADGRFSTVARSLDRVGYRPHALDRNEDSRLHQKKEEQTYLKRMGIAGAAAGNIMIYSVSLYAGASDWVAKLFNILTVLLAIPVFTYSAWPFYQNAWTALKNKTLSIDIPIAISLIMGFIMGGVGLYQGYEENYFDSLSTLVFLLLLSRYFLKKIQDRGLSSKDLHFFYQNESILRKTENGFEEIHTSFINVGDVVNVRTDEFIPADGTVVEGDSQINNSLLTGESFPDHVKAGHPVFSGAQNMGEDLLIQVDKVSTATRLGKILKSVEQGWSLRSKTVDLTALVSKYFTLAVILLASFLFLSLLPQEGLEAALSRALTLLIVTCPCALAISVPLTFHRSLSSAAKNGIIIKSDEVFEKLSKAKKFFLDKTGTVTLGKLQICDLKTQTNLNDLIFSLEHKSRHPVARALTEYVGRSHPRSMSVSDYREIPGFGVEGVIEDCFYQISGGEVRANGKVIATFTVKDCIRPDSKGIISRLQKSGLAIALLSGDRNHVVQELAREAGIHSALAEKSPEQKVQEVKGAGSVMVGDGANDAMALEAADVGIAVSGAMDIALRASDVYLTTPGLSGVEKVLVLSEETMKVVKRNLILSLLYNLVSVIFVFQGLISPLVAAIVMPASSLTVLLSTLWGTKKMRMLWKF